MAWSASLVSLCLSILLLGLVLLRLRLQWLLRTRMYTVVLALAPTLYLDHVTRSIRALSPGN